MSQVFIPHSVLVADFYVLQTNIVRSKQPIHTPLSQTCQTFRREIRGLALSARSRITSEDDIQQFIKLCRKHYLPPFIVYLAFDLCPPRSQLTSIESIRDILQTASQQFKFLNHLYFYIQSSNTMIAESLKSLFRDGTIQEFSRLEGVSVKDQPVLARFRGYNQQNRAIVGNKIVEWTQNGEIQKDIHTEAVAVARCMMRLSTLNRQLNGWINGWRRDSGVDVEWYAKDKSPQEATASPKDTPSSQLDAEVVRCQTH